MIYLSIGIFIVIAGLIYWLVKKSEKHGAAKHEIDSITATKKALSEADEIMDDMSVIQRDAYLDRLHVRGKKRGM